MAVFGLNGSGKSTLAHALSRELGLFEMDVEDYYFPEQKASRVWALEHDTVIETAHAGELPFSVPKAKAAVEAALLRDMRVHPDFVLASVTMNWCDEILACIDAALWLQTPLDVRLERIRSREEKRFGACVLAGGDMYDQQAAFRSVVASRDPKAVEACAARFTCPVITLDGTQPVRDLILRITEFLDCP